MQGLVLYSSKYGSTREYALLMAEKLGTEALSASEVHSDAIRRAQYIVLGSPIYGHTVLPEMERFLRLHRSGIRDLPAAAFVVCGDTLWNPKAEEGGHKNLAKLTDLIPSTPFETAILGGRMIMGDLDDTDGPRIKAFYERIGRQATGFDRMDMKAAVQFVERITVSLNL
jgi:menaquinone-dependent protoporphyrinogen oxidase